MGKIVPQYRKYTHLGNGQQQQQQQQQQNNGRRVLVKGEVGRKISKTFGYDIFSDRFIPGQNLHGNGRQGT